MDDYLATFHTHYGAMKFQKACKALGIKALLSPVPRTLSASCGVCARFAAENPLENKDCEDLEGIYKVLGEMEYEKLFESID